jgi:hypothetical protein
VQHCQLAGEQRFEGEGWLRQVLPAEIQQRQVHCETPDEIYPIRKSCLNELTLLAEPAVAPESSAAVGSDMIECGGG